MRQGKVVQVPEVPGRVPVGGALHQTPIDLPPIRALRQFLGDGLVSPALRVLQVRVNPDFLDRGLRPAYLKSDCRHVVPVSINLDFLEFLLPVRADAGGSSVQHGQSLGEGRRARAQTESQWNG